MSLSVTIGGNTVANKRANFVYNALGQFTSVERQVKPSSTWNEVATTAFTYDTLNRLNGIDHKRSGTSLFTAYAMTYDRMDRITGITSQDGTVAYTYDKTSQLTAADYSYQTDETWSWDANGNQNSSGYTVGTNNRITTDGTYNYTYDDEGNLTRRTKISDSSYTDYTWDYHNRLTNVTNKTSGGTSTMSADYTYDVYDRRIKKTVDADGAGAGGSVTSRYVYEDTGYTQVVLQFDGSNNLTHRYLHGPAIDQLLADEDASNNLLWSLTDHLGTVRDLVNNSGAVQNHLKYSAFGNVTAESAAAVDFLMGFAGMDRDEETAANYSWHRYLQSGRWESQDPWGFDARDENLTRYNVNSPVQYVDPNGNEPITIGTLLTIGALTGLNIWIWGKNAKMTDDLIANRPIHVDDTLASPKYYIGAAQYTAAGAATPALATGAVWAGVPTYVVGGTLFYVAADGTLRNAADVRLHYNNKNYTQALFSTGMTGLSGFGAYRSGSYTLTNLQAHLQLPPPNLPQAYQAQLAMINQLQRRHATYVAGTNNGLIVVCPSQPAPGGGPMCAEQATALLLGNGVRFTSPLSFRGGNVVSRPVCPNCQSRFSPTQFPPGTPFDLSGPWRPPTTGIFPFVMERVLDPTPPVDFNESPVGNEQDFERPLIGPLQ